jgi:hypothetical protein
MFWLHMKKKLKSKLLIYDMSPPNMNSSMKQTIKDAVTNKWNNGDRWDIADTFEDDFWKNIGVSINELVDNIPKEIAYEEHLQYANEYDDYFDVDDNDDLERWFLKPNGTTEEIITGWKWHFVCKTTDELWDSLR